MIYGIGLYIFLGYVYIKAKNILFCSIIHNLVNSLDIICNFSKITLSYYIILEILIFISLFFLHLLFTKKYKTNIKI
ncbi:hypothetical protein HMPREF0220_1554 [Clostridioides difficile NAP08]|uniref:CAAX amino terminal protease family protein n=1 Tax=Clostridioides difficile NAP08 TaxID=525259 RepID=D5Q3S2_CLODI|nr:hypothetical protein HMPREF0220_1554 [Clostridioides difficile NAP08]